MQNSLLACECLYHPSLKYPKGCVKDKIYIGSRFFWRRGEPAWLLAYTPTACELYRAGGSGRSPTRSTPRGKSCDNCVWIAALRATFALSARRSCCPMAESFRVMGPMAGFIHRHGVRGDTRPTPPGYYLGGDGTGPGPVYGGHCRCHQSRALWLHHRHLHLEVIAYFIKVESCDYIIDIFTTRSLSMSSKPSLPYCFLFGVVSLDKVPRSISVTKQRDVKVLFYIVDSSTWHDINLRKQKRGQTFLIWEVSHWWQGGKECRRDLVVHSKQIG